jgi:hypothetical protein
MDCIFYVDMDCNNPHYYKLIRVNTQFDNQFNIMCIICNSLCWVVYNAHSELGYYHHSWCPLRKITKLHDHTFTTMQVLSPYIAELNGYNDIVPIL